MRGTLLRRPPLTRRPFDPKTLAGLAIWLRAENIAGKVDGDPVGTWPDLSGLAADATQATGSKQPLLKTGANGLNGRPVVRFDGVDDLMAVAAGSTPTGVAGVTMVAVYRTVGGGSTVPRLATNSDESANGYTMSPNTVRNRFFTRPLALAADTVGSVTSTPYVVSGKYDGTTTGTNVFARANGAQVASAGATSYGTPTLGLALGATATASPSNFSNFDLAELVVYNRFVSDSDLLRLERYLGARYAVTVA